MVLALSFVFAVVGAVAQIYLLPIVVHSHHYWKDACLVSLGAANQVLEVVHFCFQNPTNHLDHLFPIFLQLPVVGLAALWLVR